MLMKSLSDKNTSDAVLFILRASKKRRSLANANAKMVQRELGIMPILIAIK
ncbi:MAG: hypothetical protein WC197_02210 [Candidatus Gastranaerophilaceae bacterium]